MAPASLRTRAFSTDRVFKNSGTRLQEDSTNGVKTELLEGYKPKKIWTPFHRDDDPWVPVHLTLTQFQCWDSASEFMGTKATQQHSYMTQNMNSIACFLKKLDLSIFS